MKKQREFHNTNVICENCGYQNHKENVKLYGTCRGCGRILDPQAKMKYEMYVRLRLWRKRTI